MLNHSCNPNTSMDPANPIAFKTIRDIFPGEEITISYRYRPKDQCDNCTHTCFCGEDNCTGTMHSKVEEYKEWVELLKKFGRNI